MGFGTGDNNRQTATLTTAHPLQADQGNPLLVVDQQNGGVAVKPLGSSGVGYAQANTIAGASFTFQTLPDPQRGVVESA